MYLIQVLRKAADAAVPNKHIKVATTPKPWNSEIKQLVQTGKEADKRWKEEGSPGPTHPLYQERKKIRKQVRRVQRIQAAVTRENNLQNIMKAQSTDQATFYRLIQQQRKNPRDNTLELTLTNKTHTGNILPIWTQQFQTWATPKLLDNFIEDYHQKVQSDIPLKLQRASHSHHGK